MSPTTERSKQRWATPKKQHITIHIILRLTCSSETGVAHSLSSGSHHVFFCCCQPPKPVPCKKGLSCALKILSHKFSVFATLNQSLYELAQVSKATEFQGCIWLGHWQVSKATEFQRKHHIILYCGCSLIQLELEMGIVTILKPRKNTCLAISTSTSTLWRMHNSRIEKMVHGSTFPVMTWLVWQHNSR